MGEVVKFPLARLARPMAAGATLRSVARDMTRALESLDRSVDQLSRTLADSRRAQTVLETGDLDAMIALRDELAAAAGMFPLTGAYPPDPNP